MLKNVLTSISQNLVLIAFLVFPALQIVSGGGLSHALWICAYVLIIFIAMHKDWQWRHLRPLQWLCALVVFACLSILWSHNQEQSLRYSRNLLGCIAIGVIFVLAASYYSAKTRHRLCFVAAIGLVIGLALVSIEWISYGTATRWWRATVEHRSDGYYSIDVLNKSLQFIVPYSFAVAALLLGKIKKHAYLLVWLILVGLLSQLNSFASFLGLLLGTLVFFLYYYSYARIVWLFKCVFVISALAVPLLALAINPAVIEIMQPHLSASALHRLYIWQLYATYLPNAFPWGLGIGAVDHLDALPSIPLALQGLGINPLLRHPHNMWLQLYLELGIIGVILYGGLVLSLINAIHRSTIHIPYRALAMGSITCYLFISMVDYNMWRDRWLAAAFICAALLRIALPKFQEASDRN